MLSVIFGFWGFVVKSLIQENKNKNAQNNKKTSGDVWFRSMVFNGK